MADQTHAHDILSDPADPRGGGCRGRVPRGTGAGSCDVVIVGASLAGCSAAILLARAGARVAVVEKSPDAGAFKRICTHYIQSSAVPTLERLGLLEPMMHAGAVRSRARIWTRWGWIEAPRESSLPSGVNLRRERLDPLIRRMAADTPGVEMILGHTVQELVHDGERVSGVKARDPYNQTVTLRARLVVGADGRGSRVAKLAGVRAKTVRHGRFAYGAKFEGPPPQGAPHPTQWLFDPDNAAVLPPHRGLPRFREDPARALVEHVAAIPDAPPIRASRIVEPAQGKLDMTNVAHAPTSPGLALVGDAALAIDPLWGVGCGWALQSSEWLADSVSEALAEPGRSMMGLEGGLKRYRRHHARKLRGHAAMMYNYAGGRKFNPGEKGLFFAASHDEHVAGVMEAFATRNIGPVRMFATTFPRTTLITTRNALRGAVGRRSGVEGLHA